MAAFHIWSVAMEASHGTRFNFEPGAANPDIIVTRQAISNSPAVAQTQYLDFDENTGDITRARITFNTNPLVAITSTPVYYKVATHEIGHLMGLGDIYPSVDANGNYRIGKKSVMNQGGGRNDRLEWMSWVITACDLDRAIAAAIRPWP